MRKISGIAIVALLMMVATVSIASATEVSIALCEKPVNSSNSWGVCSTPAQGTFTYNNVGATLLVTEASATGLADGEYSLIYYKDTDPAHVLASTKAVNVLATATAVSGNVDFTPLDINTGNIPAGDDINPRGKIWIVPTSEIVDGSLLWTGYAQGATMEGYLFESDMYTPETDPAGESTVLTRMGGISYAAVVPDSPSSVDTTGTVTVLQYEPITIGIEATNVNFGSLYQGRSGTGTSTITVTEQEGTDGYAPITVGLSVSAGDWNVDGITTIVNSVIPESVTVNSAAPATSIATLTVNVGANVPASETAYTQTITVSAIY